VSVSQTNLSALRAVWQQTQANHLQPIKRLLNACGISYDSSAAVHSQQSIALLQLAAQEAGLKPAIDELFAGAKVNISEDCAALHMALRDPKPDYNLSIDSVTDIQTTRERMVNLTRSLHQGQLPNGDPVTDILHIGIGGSDLSSQLLSNALSQTNTNTPKTHFLSAPAIQWPQLAQQLNPATTLVIAVSKSFKTLETMHNLALVDTWQKHKNYRLAVTANTKCAKQHGFNDDQILPLWPWVGGRYAFSSAVSLTAAVSMGDPAFQDLLAGAYAMDQHFCTTELQHNLPVQMALTDFWQHVVGPYTARGVFAYDPRLGLLTRWLQQLETESNGKSVTAGGEPLEMPSAPLVFGGDGSDSQHSLYQMLHQGQHVWPLEFIGVQPTPDNSTSQLLFAQLQGQAKIFNEGSQTASKHTQLTGKRPVSITLLEQLSPWHLGALLAAYEHKTYCFARLIGCNPFDQWGVEAGKHSTNDILQRFNPAAS